MESKFLFIQAVGMIVWCISEREPAISIVRLGKKSAVSSDLHHLLLEKLVHKQIIDGTLKTSLLILNLKRNDI